VKYKPKGGTNLGRLLKRRTDQLQKLGARKDQETYSVTVKISNHRNDEGFYPLNAEKLVIQGMRNRSDGKLRVMRIALLSLSNSTLVLYAATL